MIDFLKYTRWYAMISTAIIVVGLLSVVINGFNFSIDFTGGSIIEYKTDKIVSQNQITAIVQKEKIKTKQSSVNNKDIQLRTEALNEKKENNLRNSLEKQLKIKIQLQRFETVGPTIGVETIRKTTIAALVAVTGILLYMTFAFKKMNYGLAAVLAMIHDLLVLVGIYSLLSKFFGAQIDTLFVTAFLTTLSFSVHDTIIVFDKIREYKRTTTLPFYILANKSLTETMVRSINNSLTIILMLIPLTLFGGETIKFFAAALLVGAVSGVYSSPFIATPLLVFFETRKK